MPRKTDANNPADWLWMAQTDLEVYFTNRYPGFDLDDPDWPALRAQIEQVTALLECVREKLATKS